MGNILVVSRAKKLYPDIKKHLEKLGANNVIISGLHNIDLHTVIKEIHPRLVLLGSSSYQAATPFMIGRLVKKEPRLNIAAVSVNDFPLTIAPWFVWHGAKSCLHLWADGTEEFNYGLKEIIKGNEYISPVVDKVMGLFSDWPITKDKITRKQFQCLILLCCGYSAVDIANEMDVTRRSIDKLISKMFDTLHVNNKDELINCAWTGELVRKEDLILLSKSRKIRIPEYEYSKKTTNKIINEIYNAIYG